MLKKLIKENRQWLDKEIPDIARRQFFSPALRLLVKKTFDVIDRHARGKVLDAGCGDQPFRKRITAQALGYDTLDIEHRGGEPLTYTGSLLDMNMVPDQSYDTVTCFEVLEHVPQPFQAVAEINRVLRPGGTLLMSVPHLSRLHEEPHDYFRYTHYGIRSLLERNGFEVLEMAACGGMLSFLMHQFCTLLVCLFWGIPLIKHIVFLLNECFFVIPTCLIDERLSRSSVAPLQYVCVARKLHA